MPDGLEKREAVKKLLGGFGAERIFVGRNFQGEAEVSLADQEGNPRIRMVVDSEDNPRIEFLDQTGKVIYKLPPE